MKNLKIERKWPDDVMMIPVANGIFDAENRTFTECQHDPETDYYIPVSYKLSAGAIMVDDWITFLDEVLPHQQHQDLLQKMFGYCLLRDNRFSRAFYLCGPGNGKSTIINVLIHILGHENVTALNTQQLLHSSFRRAMLHNRLVNVYGQDELFITTTGKPMGTLGIFKAMVQGDICTAKHKYGNTFQFVPFAKWVGSGSEIPRMMENTSIGRRMQMIAFNEIIPPEKIQMNYHHVLLRSAPAILSWALDGLGMLIVDQGF